MFDGVEGKLSESSVAVFGPAASAAPTEIITRSYNPNKKFWQSMPKLEQEKPPKQQNQDVKIVVDMTSLRAKAIAKVNAEKGTIEVKTTAPSGAWMQKPAGPSTPQAKFFHFFKYNVRLTFFWLPLNLQGCNNSFDYCHF